MPNWKELNVRDGDAEAICPACGGVVKNVPGLALQRLVNERADFAQCQCGRWYQVILEDVLVEPAVIQKSAKSEKSSAIEAAFVDDGKKDDEEAPQGVTTKPRDFDFRHRHRQRKPCAYLLPRGFRYANAR